MNQRMIQKVRVVLKHTCLNIWKCLPSTCTWLVANSQQSCLKHACVLFGKKKKINKVKRLSKVNQNVCVIYNLWNVAQNSCLLFFIMMLGPMFIPFLMCESRRIIKWYMTIHHIMLSGTENDCIIMTEFYKSLLENFHPLLHENGC